MERRTDSFDRMSMMTFWLNGESENDKCVPHHSPYPPQDKTNHQKTNKIKTPHFVEWQYAKNFVDYSNFFYYHLFLFDNNA